MREAKARNERSDRLLTTVRLIAVLVSICCCAQIYNNNDYKANALPNFSWFNLDELIAQTNGQVSGVIEGIKKWNHLEPVEINQPESDVQLDESDRLEEVDMDDNHFSSWDVETYDITVEEPSPIDNERSGNATISASN